MKAIATSHLFKILGAYQISSSCSMAFWDVDAMAIFRSSDSSWGCSSATSVADSDLWSPAGTAAEATPSDIDKSSMSLLTKRAKEAHKMLIRREQVLTAWLLRENNGINKKWQTDRQMHGWTSGQTDKHTTVIHPAGQRLTAVSWGILVTAEHPTS